MKFSLFAIPAMAAFTLAASPVAGERASSGDVWLDADDLARGFDISASPVQDAADGVNIQAISTNCAARPRPGTVIERRAFEDIDTEEEELYGLFERQDSECPNPGHLTRPGARIFIKGITFQRCANTCVCRGDFNGCQTFAWKPNGRGFGRGRCILYTKTLAEMDFTPGMGGEGDFPTRNFYARTCFRRGQPLPSSIQTTAIPAPTPRVKRDITLGDNLMAAMLQV